MGLRYILLCAHKIVFRLINTLCSEHMDCGGIFAHQPTKDSSISQETAKILWVRIIIVLLDKSTSVFDVGQCCILYLRTELRFPKCVIPTSILVYETYHPGAVVKILACNADPNEKTAKRSGEVEYVGFELNCSLITNWALILL